MSVVSCTQELYCSVKYQFIVMWGGGGDFVEP